MSEFPPTRPRAPRLGIYFDGPRPSTARQIDATADTLARCVDAVTLDLNASGGEALSTWREGTLGAFTAALQHRELEVRWMARPVHTAAAVAAHNAALQDLYSGAARNLPAAPALEVDLEESTLRFTRKMVVAYLAGLDAVPLRANGVLRANGELPAHIALWLDEAEALVLQAYLAYLKPEDPDHWTHAEAFRPAGRYLRTNIEAAARIEARWPHLRVALAQALYGQQHPAPHPRGVEALRATRALLLPTGRDIEEWSSKHALGQDAVLEYLVDTRLLIREAA